MSIQRIREYYGVPAKVRGRVEYTGGKEPCLGTITGARGAKLLIRLDHQVRASVYHPTWEIRYLEAKQ